MVKTMVKIQPAPKKLLTGLFLMLAASFFLAACGGAKEEAMDEAKMENASILATVIDRDVLTCGVSTGLPGFSAPNTDGEWEGIDVDGCKAIAAAVLGDASKVNYVPLTGKERFTALQSGEVDVIVRNTTWTLTRDGSLGINFAGVNYYDGQGFLVKKATGITKATELDNVAVCVQSGTTTELNLADFMRFNKLRYSAVTFDTSDQTVKGFEEGRCDTLTSDRSQLAALRIKLSDPDSAVLLEEVISKEPLGPAVRQGDDEWFNIVKWVFWSQLEAEELGINSQNVMTEKDNPAANPNAKRLLGAEGNLGQVLGLSADWGVKVISQVGNYAEMYERNVGADSPLQLARGVNRLWKDGGLMYPMPFR